MYRIVMIACLLAGNIASAAEQPGPEALVANAQAAVDRYISGFIAELESIQPLYESDRQAYFAAIESSLSGFVDFREVARGVMARYSTGPDGASAAQLDRFAEVFKTSLIRFYGRALADYGGFEYEILPLPEPPSDPARSTNVRMSIEGEDGSEYELQYNMYRNDSGKWLMRNLYVEGVNLRRQYHAQFESLMMTHDYDIDKVIDAWEVTE